MNKTVENDLVVISRFSASVEIQRVLRLNRVSIALPSALSGSGWYNVQLGPSNSSVGHNEEKGRNPLEKALYIPFKGSFLFGVEILGLGTYN